MRSPFVYAAVLVSSLSSAAEVPKTPGNAAQCVCVEATNGARDAEPLAARIARLETALRLSKMERVVRKAKR